MKTSNINTAAVDSTSSFSVKAVASKVLSYALAAARVVVSALVVGTSVVLSHGIIAPIAAAWLVAIAAGTVLTQTVTVGVFAAAGLVGYVASLGLGVIVDGLRAGKAYVRDAFTERRLSKDRLSKAMTQGSAVNDLSARSAVAA